MSPDLIRTLLNIKASAIVASSHSIADIQTVMKTHIKFQEWIDIKVSQRRGH